ncbi:hypothetical protein ACFO1B_29655 [Dactylosporangium siamense]|uniref:Lipoprotein n=1 Tax=Dactylosporangium siamense TaxID=685454 RepID=A0A919PWW3_9ACTN|nr:hypothetical protein [Dactylosporangium siamense]GIG51787.1 hypothetical protein Dsi01nite_098280 [Dactylosporangium siamense]
MTFAWKRTAALIVAVSVVFGTGACGDKAGDSGSGTPAAATATSSKAPEPKDVLLGSLAQYDKGVYAANFTSHDGSGQAAIDAPKKQAYIKIASTDPEAAFTMEVLLVEPDAYVKMNMGELAKLPGMQQLNGKTWMHIDRTKVKDGGSLGIATDETDMLDLKALLQGAQSVQAAGDHKYSGTLDLAKGADSPMTDEDVVKALGDKAATVPFTATLDAQGQLTELLIDVPAAGETKAHQLKLTMTEYGTATVPAKPTGKAVVEAPANVYDIFNG